MNKPHIYKYKGKWDVWLTGVDRYRAWTRFLAKKKAP